MSTRKKSDAEIIAELRKLITELEARAHNGSEAAQWELERARFAAYVQFRERAWEQAQEGGQAIAELLSMADFSINRLLWLARNRADKVKPLARHRYTWPGYAALNDATEKHFRELLGEFDQAGRRVAVGPIELGAQLPFSMNRKTKDGVLLQIAMHAVSVFCGEKRHIDGSLDIALTPLHPRLARLSGDDLRRECGRLLDSRGKFSADNWSKWKPVFESYLTLHYGPFSTRWDMLTERDRDNLFVAEQFGCARFWFDRYVKQNRLSRSDAQRAKIEFESDPAITASMSKRPIDDWTDVPEVAAVINAAHRRTPPRKPWQELKVTLLDYIQRLAQKPL
jgi:hypothetical protein